MASVTLTVSEETKADLKRFTWVNWSEVAREAVTGHENAARDFERFRRLVAKSKLSKEDAEALSKKVKSSMHRRLVTEGLI